MGHHLVLLGDRTMNISLLQEIDKRLLEAIGMIVLEDPISAEKHLICTRQALRIIIDSWNTHPMTLTELEHEFSLRKKEITG